MIPMKNTLLSVIAAFVAFSAFAQEPDGYYTPCEGASGAALLTKLKNKISSHTTISYDGLWSVYNESDIDENGKIWDMYSTKRWTPGKEKCGSYKKVGDCINREHSFPKSWFNDAKPMYSDAFHLYPTDGKVNGQRSNYPYGECANGTNLGTSGGVRALGRLGKSTFPGYSGTVFEPDDEYKGDFARSYFYMAACYNDRIASWHSDMLSGNSYPVFTSWALNLLLKWHRQDPVSQKEIDRNNAVYRHQRNRNPFIDHPELAEHVWGDKTSTAWYIDSTPEPEIILPVSGSNVSFGTVATESQASVSVMVKASGLTESVKATVSNPALSLSRPSIPAADACTSAGTPLAINWNPAAAGSISATLTLMSGNARSVVSISGTAVDGLPALPAADITPTSFTACWIYVGDADAHDCYALHVKDAYGAELPGFPRDVTATAQQYTVTGLSPLTGYSYHLVSAGQISNVVNVTTGELIPYIDAMTDNTAFTAAPDEPSAAGIIDLDFENITTDVEAIVKAPFELSTDRTNWSTFISFPTTTNTIYVRLGATSVGEYESSVTVTANGVTNDQITLSGIVSELPEEGVTYFVADGYELSETAPGSELVTIYNPDKSTSSISSLNTSVEKSLAREGYCHTSSFATVSFAKGSAGNTPVVCYQSNEPKKSMRVYKGNTITLTPLNNGIITKVEIHADANTAFTINDKSYSGQNFVITYEGQTPGEVTATTPKVDISYIAVTTAHKSSGIEDVEIEETDEPASYFDLRGIPVTEPRAGEVYIKVTAKGAEKVIYK